MKIRAYVALVLLTAMAGCALHSRRDVLETTHATAVRLEMNDAGSCSGTAIGEHLLLSATHCFQDLVSLKVNGRPVTVLKRVDDGKDHTILLLDMKFASWSEVGKAPKRGDVVFIWGNPADYVDLYREGRVAGYRSEEGGQFTVVDMPSAFFGDSGSGIFGEDGKIVGVTSFLAYEEHQGIGLKFMGFFPLAFAESQYAEVGYAAR